jgi:hypothetical protein
MELCVGRLTLRQFYGRDSETPYISFMVIAALFDDFWRHPVRSAHECILLRGQRARQLPGNTKVCKFHFSPGGKENICGWGKDTVLRRRGEVTRAAYL